MWFGAHPLAPLGISVTLAAIGLVLSLRGAKRRGNPVFAPALSPVVILNSLVVILSETKDLLVSTVCDPHRRIYRLAVLSFTLLIFLPITTHAAVFRPDVDDNWPARSPDYFFYVHTDYLGSSNLLTEGEAKATHGGFRFAKGELVQRVEYTPFGKERFVLNSALEELPKYTGQTDDIDTDLYYYGSRYYDPVLGRFIQPDSIIADVYSSQSLNPYAYVLNNPLRYVDPFGYAASERDNYKVDDLVSDSEQVQDSAIEGENPGAVGYQSETGTAVENSLKVGQNKTLAELIEEISRSLTVDLDQARKIANEVLWETRLKFPNSPDLHNDEADAWRHARWNERMTKEISPLTAGLVGYGHEMENLRDQWKANKPLKWQEMLMDLHNNREGRSGLSADESLERGRLRTIEPAYPGQGGIY